MNSNLFGYLDSKFPWLKYSKSGIPAYDLQGIHQSGIYYLDTIPMIGSNKCEAHAITA